jgi:heterodisulfide reductase subunit B
MQCAVYDTYVKKQEGGLMHFDIIVPQATHPDAVLVFGRQYLESKGQAGQELTTQECSFCHIEQATREVEEAIENKGFFILEMQGC